MQRTIPGTIDVEGREFLYIEMTRNEGFRKIVDEALASCVDVPKPTSGGVLEHRVYIQLPDGSLMLPVSYKGDVDGWRQKFEAFCALTDRKWGVAKSGRVNLSNGDVLDLTSVEVVFE